MRHEFVVLMGVLFSDSYSKERQVSLVSKTDTSPVCALLAAQIQGDPDGHGGSRVRSSYWHSVICSVVITKMSLSILIACM